MIAPSLVTDHWETIARSLLAEHGLQFDPQFRGEIRDMFDSPGLRRRYVRRSGPRIDGFGEMLYDRGATVRRPDCREVLEILDALELGSTRERSARPQRVARATVDAAESKARKMRMRKYQCPKCSQIVRGTRTTLVFCGVCYEMHNVIERMYRVDPLPEEILTQAAAHA